MSYQHVIVVSEKGKRTLSLFLPDGERPIVITDEDPNYDRLLFEADQGELSPEGIRRYILNEFDG